MVGVHVRLDFEHERAESVIFWRDLSDAGVAWHWGEGMLDEEVKKQLDAEVVYCASEEDGGDFAFDEDEINEALKARQAYLAELKEKAKDKEPKKAAAAAPAKKGFSDLGF